MSWIKQVFTDFQTVITAAFLNDLQDQIIADETAVSGMVSGVKGNSENSYRHGNVNLTKANIGLGNVDNTSDAQKPVSNATQDALDSKVDKVTGKGLSTNDYTTAEKQKVAASALQTDLEAVDDRVDQIYNGGVLYDTTTGDIAAFSDGADGLPMKALVATIEPVQEGTGDPSPTNVRPITGRTGLTGKRTSGNLANVLYAEVGSGSTLVRDSSTGSLHFTNNASSRYASLSILGRGVLATNSFPKGEYTVSFDIAGTITTNWIAGTRSVSGNLYSSIERVTFSSAGHYSFTFDSSAWTEDYYLSIGRTGNETSDIDVTVSNLTIVPGAAEGTFEPYVSQDISVNWQSQAGTVYGGAVDVVNGELTVNATKIVTPVANGTDSQNLLYTIYRSLPPESTAASTTSAQKAKSNIGTFIGLSQARASEVPCFTQVETTLYARIPSASTVAEATQWLSDNNVEIWYPLRDHQTYQLTPQEVTTLLGNNMVYTDVGPVSVTAPRDTKMYVDNKIAEAVAAALNA